MRKLTIIIGLTVLFAVWSFPAKSLADGSGPSRSHKPKRRAHATRINCLPPEIKADDVISYGMNGRSNITVEKKVTQLRARCRNGKLVDVKGRGIRFFRPSCWGNPPADYAEIQQRENEELQKLRKRYTVILFECNPMIQ